MLPTPSDALDGRTSSALSQGDSADAFHVGMERVRTGVRCATGRLCLPSLALLPPAPSRQVWSNLPEKDETNAFMKTRRMHFRRESVCMLVCTCEGVVCVYACMRVLCTRSRERTRHRAQTKLRRVSLRSTLRPPPICTWRALALAILSRPPQAMTSR